MRTRRPIRVAALVSALGLGSLGGLGTAAGVFAVAAGPAGAAPAPTSCLSVSFPGTRLIDWDGYNPKVEFSPAKAAALVPGAYTVTGTSHDGYPSRVGVTQTSEIWELQFLDAGGNVIATSATTADLPDRVAGARWSGSLGTVTLPTAAVAVRAHHRPDAIADGSANSVEPTAATICPVGVDDVTTIAPTTTARPASTSTTATTTTTAPPSTTTTSSTTTAPATTTTGGPTTTAPPTSLLPVTVTVPVTVPVRAEVPPSVSVLAATTVVGSNGGTTPTRALATTGTGSEPLGGVALILLGVGVLALGWRAQAVSRRA